jgi:BirA family biotin operon repressor/biotin-[acetyl-CoA-carboxylase] ligase
LKNFIVKTEVEMDVYRSPESLFERVLKYKKVSSTQDIVKNIAKKNCGAVVVVCEQQVSGYGRFKRKWHSAKGGLWFSILLKPKVAINEFPKLSLLFAVAIKRVFCENYKIYCKIKWSNDILIYGKKISGILIESFCCNGFVFAAVGIGININNVIDKELREFAVSLREVLGKEVNMDEFFNVLLEKIEKVYFDFEKSGFSQFVEEYNDSIAYKNEVVDIVDDIGESKNSGVNLGIDSSAALLIETENKQIKRIISGTLRLASKGLKTDEV